MASDSAAKPVSFQVEISKYAPPGHGLGYYNGKAVFVPATAVGDVVNVIGVREKKRFITASLIEIVSPSADRITAECPHYDLCGGCSLMHLPYAKQIELKQQLLRETFQQFALSVNPVVIPSPHRKEFRFRSQLKCSDSIVGFSKRNSNQVFNLTDCLVLSRGIQHHIGQIKQLGRSQCEFHFLASLSEGTVALTITENGRNHPVPGFPSSVIEDYGFGSVLLHSSGFAQSNPFVTRMIIDALLVESRGAKEICELYCGCGTFSIPLARQVERLVGIDIDKKSVETAEKNAARNRLKNTHFQRMNLEKKRVPIEADTIVVDPPRKGLTQTALHRIGQSKAERLLYVSCHPATLARDASSLVTEQGFEMTDLKGYDMYCHSTHLETLAIFRR